MIFIEETVISRVIARYGRRMCSPWFMDDSADFKGRTQHPIWVTNNYFVSCNLFCNNNYVAGRQHCFLCHSKIAPQVRVTFFIAALYMYNGDVRMYCRYEHERGTIKW